MDRYLPAPGFERKAFLALTALVMVLKVMAILHYRIDSDETQHAHVVWAWATGRLPYRDVFDNHMPLFQAMCAPLFRLLGEHSYIMIELRIAMLPIFFLCLWCVFRLAETLYSTDVARWASLCAAALPQFFYTSTEFRTDQLWAAFWLLSLLIAVSGKFTVKRAFGFGLLIGLAIAVSLKTAVLLAALGTATLIALVLAWCHGERPAIIGSVAKLLAIASGAVIAPAATVLYFTWQGAYRIMLYCVIQHNVVPKMKRWGHFSLHQWDFPIAVIVMGVYAWLIFRQTRTTPLAIRRVIILLTPWLFLCFLLSYWPDITREDDLPYTPLVPLSVVPVLILAGAAVRDGQWRNFSTYGLPAICFAELLCVWNVNPLRTDRVKGTTRGIADVLLLTHPNEYIMDAKGDYVFRPRPYYWVIETITKSRIRLGWIRDRIPESLENTGTQICYLDAAHILPDASRFIVTNYMPFDPEAIDVGAAGKELGKPTADENFSFDVSIPATYALISESGMTTGTLDGTQYSGPLRLNAGHHEFHRLSGTGRAAIFLDRAAAAGFHPLFDASEKFIKQEETRGK